MRAIYDFEQRSPEWHAIRWGRITGTDFKTLATGTMAARNKLVLLKRYQLANPPEIPEEINAFSLNWGRENEEKAAARYEFAHMVDLLYPAFIIHPVHDFIGVSPDAISHDVGVEIKCPSNQDIHRSTWNLGMPIEHYPQTQGGIWVAEKPAWDFVSFDPRLPPPKDYYEQRIMRDDDYITKLERRCLEFWDLVNSDKEIGGDLENLPQLF